MSTLISGDKFITAIFFLFLGLAGGYVADGIMSCGIRKMIVESIAIKHVVFFVLIYFAIGFVDSETTSPLSILLSAVLVYSMFMIIMKSQKEYVLVAVVLLGILFVLRKVRTSFDPLVDPIAIENIDRFSSILNYVIFLIVLVGFVIYFRRQYMEHKATFTLTRFFFGTNKCASIA